MTQQLPRRQQGSKKSSTEASIPVVFFKTRMCRYHLLGTCTKGSECGFAHEASELLPPPDFSCTRICDNIIKKGHCDVVGCTWAHSKEELRRRKPNGAELAQKKEQKKKNKAKKAKKESQSNCDADGSTPRSQGAMSRPSTGDLELDGSFSRMTSLASPDASSTSVGAWSGAGTASTSGTCSSAFSSERERASQSCCSLLISQCVIEVPTPPESSEGSSMYEGSMSLGCGAKDGQQQQQPVVYQSPVGMLNGLSYQVKNTFLDFTALEVPSSRKPGRSSSTPAGKR